MAAKSSISAAFQSRLARDYAPKPSQKAERQERPRQPHSSDLSFEPNQGEGVTRSGTVRGWRAS